MEHWNFPPIRRASDDGHYYWLPFEGERDNKPRVSTLVTCAPAADAPRVPTPATCAPAADVPRVPNPAIYAPAADVSWVPTLATCALRRLRPIRRQIATPPRGGTFTGTAAAPTGRSDGCAAPVRLFAGHVCIQRVLANVSSRYFNIIIIIIAIFYCRYTDAVSSYSIHVCVIMCTRATTIIRPHFLFRKNIRL